MSASECQGGTSEPVSTESKTVKDENENVLVSTKIFFKPFNTNDESSPEFGNDCEKKIEKKKQKPSPTPDNAAQGSSKQVVPELEMSKMNPAAVSDDEDYYKECFC